jgi:hypothetical protein
MRNRRLHTDTDQTVGVIDGLPAVTEQFAVDRVAAAFVFRVEFRAVVHQQSNDGIPAFVSRAVEGRASIAVDGVDVDAEVETHFDGFEIFFLRGL